MDGATRCNNLAENGAVVARRTGRNVEATLGRVRSKAFGGRFTSRGTASKTGLGRVETTRNRGRVRVINRELEGTYKLRGSSWIFLVLLLFFLFGCVL